MNIKTAKNILDYWYKLECFTPFDPKNEKSNVIISPIDEIPWEMDDNTNGYNVYLGRIKVRELIDLLKRVLNLEDKNFDTDESLTCVCVFQLSSNGIYVENSFTAAYFIWAISQVIKYKSFNVDLSDDALKDFNESINKELTGISESLTYDSLNKIYDVVKKKLKINLAEYALCAVCNANADEETSDENELSANDKSNDMFPSFYKKDLIHVRDSITKDDAIFRYITSPLIQRNDTVEIDCDVKKMKEWLSPPRFPLGKWPSRFNPSLMQQMAINIAISGKESIFSVNGPPGTGKTTLLKEVIASNLVQKAKLLAEYEKPDDAFEMVMFQNPGDKFSSTFYKFKDSGLSQYSIIVASNNNAAVENISRELPIAFDKGKTLTGFFEKLEDDVYFTKTAQILNKTDRAWGLISARLGKKENIREFIRAVIDDKSGVKALIPPKNEFDFQKWNEAKKSFNDKYNEVLSYRKKITAIAEKKYAYMKHNESGLAMNRKILRLKSEIDFNNSKLEELLEKQEENQKSIERTMAEVDLLQSKTGLFKKIKNALAGENKNDKLSIAKSKLLELYEADGHIEQDINKLQGIQKKIEKECKSLTVMQKEVKDFDSTNKKIFGDSYANNDFFTDITKNRNSQKICPWVNEEYDKMREELFFLAMQLHKEFILVSNAVKQNLDRYSKMIKGEYKNQRDKHMAYASLLNTVQLVVPVISTTFASISIFLQHVDKEELGTLVIDEAGQATPLSAVGAIWRAKKTIVVGDPLQVTPVASASYELTDILAGVLGVDNSYCSLEHSVQSFSDNINPYGSARQIGDKRLWIGCPLVVHRRCLSPMFDISNEIAYEGRMFNETYANTSNISLSMEKSQWLDIKGPEKGMKDHYVAAQGEKAVELFAEAFNKHGTDTSLYVISPFKSVINQFKTALNKHLSKNFQVEKKKLKEFIDKSCGTVHTFQGKEANEVILLLGCDQKSGMGAAFWVGSGPNILNVAASRAKYRITIIGDKELWRKVRFFDRAIELIEK